MTIHIHFVGIKGTGMSAAALISAKLENTIITGSDVQDRFFTDAVLERAGISVLPFSAENVDETDLVVVSAAYNSDNPEISRAVELNIKILTYPQYLAQLMSDRRVICITGTHGKTTTTAMVSMIMLNADYDPAVVVGSEVPFLGGNAHAGSGEWFVAESCEYRRHFLNYSPECLVILNMELDHPDYFKDLDDVVDAFQELSAKIPSNGKLIIWGDDPSSLSISAACPIITYGFSQDNIYRADNLISSQSRISFEVLHLGESLGIFSLGTSGNHNVLNALAAIALCRAIGVPDDDIRSGLAQFEGTKRRFEKLGEYNGGLIVDDYAHHPTEISATLQGARQAYPDRKIIAVFQPHTLTRTIKLMDSFATCFTQADEVVVAEIFASAREKASTKISSSVLADKIALTGVKTTYFETHELMESYLADHINHHHLVITLGAGDIYKVGLGLVART